MPGWFTSKHECPVDPETRAWIDQRWAWLTGQFGADRLEAVQVILPTPEFFPNSYSGSEEDIQTFHELICGYMGIPPETVEWALYQDRNPVYEGELQQRTSGLFHEEDGKYHVWIEAANIHDPVGLVATLAHELGHVHLLGHGRLSPDAKDHEPLTDLLTVFLGMGLFTANTVIHEKYWQEGMVAGINMGRRGYLSMPMYGYALALFAQDRAEDNPSWAKYLRPDVDVPFRKACGFLADPDNQQPAEGSRPPVEYPKQAYAEPEDEPDPTEGSDADHAELEEELLGRYQEGRREFRNIKLQGFNLAGANLREVDLTDANLNGADLSEADLSGAVLTDADLSEANVQLAVLSGTTLCNANLFGADLTGADLTHADLTGADIRDANFTGGIFKQTILIQTVRNRFTDFADVDLHEAVCETNLSLEYQDEVMPTEAMAASVGRVGSAIGGVFIVGGFAIIGIVLGLVAGSVLNIHGDITAMAGAGIFGFGAAVKLIGSRAAVNSDHPDQS